MKKSAGLFCIALLTFLNVNGQDTTATVKDTVWKTGGIVQAQFSQVNLSNWAAGGQNSMSLNALANMFSKYRKGHIYWDTNLDLGYGITKQGDEKMRKNDDRLELNSKVGHEAYKNKLFYTLLFNFKSQFTEGYNYPRTDSSNYISKFLAPAFTLVSLGIDYKEKDYLTVFISPVTARWVIVNDDSLSNAGAFGVEPGDKVRTEYGAYFTARFQKDVVKNVNIMTKLDLFSNYKEDPKNIDVNWDFLLSLKATKFITVTFGTTLIYDDNTLVPIFKDDGTTPVLDASGVQKTGPRTQFRQVFGVGIAYKMERFFIK